MYKRGFTLPEVMTVVVILAILSTIVLANVGEARKKTRDAVRLRDIREMAEAIDLYVIGGGSLTTLPETTGSTDANLWSSFLQTLGLVVRLDPQNGTTLEGVSYFPPGAPLYLQSHSYVFARDAGPLLGSLSVPIICTTFESRKAQQSAPSCDSLNPLTATNNLFPTGCSMSGGLGSIYGTNPWVCLKVGYNK